MPRPFERDVTAQPDDPGLRRVVGRETAARLQTGHRADEQDRPTLAHLGQQPSRDDEMRAQVHRKGRVPVRTRRPAQADPASDPDVEHQPVHGANGRSQQEASVLGRDVADDHLALALLLGDHRHGLGRRIAVAVSAQHGCALAGSQHRDRPPVADRRVRVGRRLGASTDHEDAPAGQTRLAHRSKPGTPGSRCTPSEFSVIATMW